MGRTRLTNDEKAAGLTVQQKKDGYVVQDGKIVPKELPIVTIPAAQKKPKVKNIPINKDDTTLGYEVPPAKSSKESIEFNTHNNIYIVGKNNVDTVKQIIDEDLGIGVWEYKTILMSKLQEKGGWTATLKDMGEARWKFCFIFPKTFSQIQSNKPVDEEILFQRLKVKK